MGKKSRAPSAAPSARSSAGPPTRKGRGCTKSGEKAGEKQAQPVAAAHEGIGGIDELSEPPTPVAGKRARRHSRVKAEGNMELEAEEAEATVVQKACVFKCGSICFVSPDPINKSRKSIRWAYDLKESSECNGKGAACWYCERTFTTSVAHTLDEDERNREDYIGKLGGNADVLNDFLELRKNKTIARAKSKQTAEQKRPGLPRWNDSSFRV